MQHIVENKCSCHFVKQVELIVSACLTNGHLGSCRILKYRHIPHLLMRFGGMASLSFDCLGAAWCAVWLGPPRAKQACMQWNCSARHTLGSIFISLLRLHPEKSLISGAVLLPSELLLAKRRASLKQAMLHFNLLSRAAMSLLFMRFELALYCPGNPQKRNSNRTFT